MPLVTNHDRQNGLPEKLAVKLYRAKPDISELDERFIEIFSKCHAISHPQIARHFGLTMYKGFIAIVREYIEGIRLSQLLDQAEPLSIAEAKRIILQIIGLLEELDRYDVRNKRLVPDNFILRDTGSVTLINLGLSSYLKDVKHACVRQFKLVSLKWEYWPPSDEFSERSYVYICGLIFNELLRGRSLRPADLETFDLTPYLGGNRPPLPKLVGSAAEFNLLIKVATSRNPQERFSSLDMLRKAITGEIDAQSYSPSLVQKAGDTLRRYRSKLMAELAGSKQ